MNGFDLMTRAEQTADKAALHNELRSRPFELFHPSNDDEVRGYVADESLRAAVNVSLAVGRPLLLTGEPGTGKTSAATWIAGQLGLELKRFQVKSNSRAQDLLYTFNSIEYFREAQIAAAANKEAPKKSDFIEEGVFWQALKTKDQPVVLLIDEIDKAPRDLPNDLLYEMDRMEIVCIERNREHIVPADDGLRPIVVITSNSERRLPEPFLRRCVYHNIVLDDTAINRIVDKKLELTRQYFTAAPDFRSAAVRCFFALRANDALQKKPSIGEFWEWFAHTAQCDGAVRNTVLEVAAGRAPPSRLPFLCALIKLSEDEARLS
jgi:MoxR-like ATPase